MKIDISWFRRAHSSCKIIWTGSAREALNLCGTIIGFYPIRVLPSKTAILPVNPTFLPRVWMILAITAVLIFKLPSWTIVHWLFYVQSEDEREMCARTVYCTNIDKMVFPLLGLLSFPSCHLYMFLAIFITAYAYFLWWLLLCCLCFLAYLHEIVSRNF